MQAHLFAVLQLAVLPGVSRSEAVAPTSRSKALLDTSEPSTGVEDEVGVLGAVFTSADLQHALLLIAPGALLKHCTDLVFVFYLYAKGCSEEQVGTAFSIGSVGLLVGTFACGAAWEPLLRGHAVMLAATLGTVAGAVGFLLPMLQRGVPKDTSE